MFFWNKKSFTHSFLGLLTLSSEGYWVGELFSTLIDKEVEVDIYISASTENDIDERHVQIWSEIENSYSEISIEVAQKIKAYQTASKDAVFIFGDDFSQESIMLEAVVIEEDMTTVLHWGAIPKGAKEAEMEVLTTYGSNISVLGISD